MCLWSVHPKYLDAKGLTACWREGLLARKVLLGQTKGYRNHPQLVRFRAAADPMAAVDVFLSFVLAEAQSRGYRYDATKIDLNARCHPLPVTQGQLEYEFEHLKKKLAVRDRVAYERLLSAADRDANPLFEVVAGPVEHWENTLP